MSKLQIMKSFAVGHFFVALQKDAIVINGWDRKTSKIDRKSCKLINIFPLVNAHCFSNKCATNLIFVLQMLLDLSHLINFMVFYETQNYFDV